MSKHLFVSSPSPPSLLSLPLSPPVPSSPYLVERKSPPSYPACAGAACIRFWSARTPRTAANFPLLGASSERSLPKVAFRVAQVAFLGRRRPTALRSSVVGVSGGMKGVIARQGEWEKEREERGGREGGEGGREGSEGRE